MTERLLRKGDIAAMLGTSPGVAASILAERGVHPVDFGYGRARGQRWLESAVRQAMLAMHEAAQPKASRSRPRKPPTVLAGTDARLASLSINDLHMLTQKPCVQ